MTALNAGILNIPGIKFNPNGYSIDNPKLIKVSLINIIWVFLYTAQKEEIKYQKKKINNKLKMKNIANFIFIYVLIWFYFFCATLKFFSCFIDNICLSDKDNCFKIILITEDIRDEYNICGI